MRRRKSRIKTCQRYSRYFTLRCIIIRNNHDGAYIWLIHILYKEINTRTKKYQRKTKSRKRKEKKRKEKKRQGKKEARNKGSERKIK